MLESLFKKLAGWRLATSLKKTPTQVFSCEVGEIFKNTFSYRTPPVTASALPVAASVFFLKKYYLTAISQPCYDVLIIFSSRHIVWCIKSRTRLFINLSSIVKFSKQLRQGVPYKAENWHAWSHEQYFLEPHFLDISQCVFNITQCVI